ncbi:hypothetical protein AK812_SmicGene6605 [Symbiodinium microadriaticum]|uniref:Uncharacterized protein n=1 Tax=Symbiodinium microadriaticum TaxID=2951 RepID=A0A1Q9EQP0_SYMMI|nr:hypothetical protein AK812_SmicGene6605 [Symbiodinium microadriaticum]
MGRTRNSVSTKGMPIATISCDELEAPKTTECTQLLFQGSHLNACKPNNAKTRLQFLGVKVMEPPIGDEAVAWNQPFSDSIVTRDVHLLEATTTGFDHGRSVQPAVIRLDKVHAQIDPDKFAINSSVSLVDTIKGSYRATDYHNLRSIVENSARCFSVFQSCGKFRSAAPRRKSPLEVPTEEIANAREEATAARSSLVSIHDDGDGDARTMAESGMEVDSDMDVDEVEPDDAQQDVDENENQDEIAERRPVLVQENTHIIVPVSRDVTDEGLLSYIRGARQMGMQRVMFNPSAYFDGKEKLSYLNHGQIGISDRPVTAEEAAAAKQGGKLLTVTNVTANVIEASVADGKVTITDVPRTLEISRTVIKCNFLDKEIPLHLVGSLRENHGWSKIYVVTGDSATYQTEAEAYVSSFQASGCVFTVPFFEPGRTVAVE